MADPRAAHDYCEHYSPDCETPNHHDTPQAQQPEEEVSICRGDEVHFEIWHGGAGGQGEGEGKREWAGRGREGGREGAKEQGEEGGNPGGIRCSSWS